jgi:hypothetical protein
LLRAFACYARQHLPRKFPVTFNQQKFLIVSRYQYKTPTQATGARKNIFGITAVRNTSRGPLLAQAGQDNNEVKQAGLKQARHNSR